MSFAEIPPLEKWVEFEPDRDSVFEFVARVHSINNKNISNNFPEIFYRYIRHSIIL